MKDYRQYTRPYKPNEWEKDKEWLINRLEFLWTLREYYPEIYNSRGFGAEKEALYGYRENEKIIAAANKLNTDQYLNKDYRFETKENKDLIKEYRELCSTWEKDIDTFLRKRIYVKYELLKKYISENILEEEYIYYSEGD